MKWRVNHERHISYTSRPCSASSLFTFTVMLLVFVLSVLIGNFASNGKIEASTLDVALHSQAAILYETSQGSNIFATSQNSAQTQNYISVALDSQTNSDGKLTKLLLSFATNFDASNSGSITLQLPMLFSLRGLFSVSWSDFVELRIRKASSILKQLQSCCINLGQNNSATKRNTVEIFEGFPNYQDDFDKLVEQKSQALFGASLVCESSMVMKNQSSESDFETQIFIDEVYPIK